MAFHFRTDVPEPRQVFHTLKARTVVSRDGKRVVIEGKEDGQLLGAAGARIPQAQAERLGLLAHEDAPGAPQEPAQAPEAPEPAKVEDKAIPGPSRGKKRGGKP